MRSHPSVHRRRGSLVSIGFVLALMLAVAGPIPAARATGGAQLWVARYNNPRNGYDYATAVAVSPDGASVYVTGYGSAKTSSAYHFETVAYDAMSGARIWAPRCGQRR